MNIPQRQIEGLTAFGYTVSEARFLYIVAMHSGYFTARQFLAFVDAKRGYRTRSLAQKLITQGHATIREYRRNGCIYHLYSRALCPAWPREPSQPPPASAGSDPDTASRTRFHPRQPGVSVPRNGSGKGRLCLRPIAHRKGLPSGEAVHGRTDQPTHPALFRRQVPVVHEFSPSRLLPRLLPCGHVFLCRSGARNNHRICYSPRAIPAALS